VLHHLAAAGVREEDWEAECQLKSAWTYHSVSSRVLGSITVSAQECLDLSQCQLKSAWRKRFGSLASHPKGAASWVALSFSGRGGEQAHICMLPVHDVIIKIVGSSREALIGTE
jgi:hypothetical protein